MQLWNELALAIRAIESSAAIMGSTYPGWWSKKTYGVKDVTGNVSASPVLLANTTSTTS
jgi:hypothetical protein